MKLTWPCLVRRLSGYAVEKKHAMRYQETKIVLKTLIFLLEKKHFFGSWFANFLL